MNGAVAGNQLTIEGANASLTGALRTASGGTLDVHLSQGGTGGVLNTSVARITTLGVGQGGNVQLALNKNSSVTPVISATGPVRFGFGSQVTLVPTSFLPNNGDLHADPQRHIAGVLRIFLRRRRSPFPSFSMAR